MWHLFTEEAKETITWTKSKNLKLLESSDIHKLNCRFIKKKTLIVCVNEYFFTYYKKISFQVLLCTKSQIGYSQLKPQTSVHLGTLFSSIRSHRTLTFMLQVFGVGGGSFKLRFSNSKMIPGCSNRKDRPYNMHPFPKSVSREMHIIKQNFSEAGMYTISYSSYTFLLIIFSSQHCK